MKITNITNRGSVSLQQVIIAILALLLLVVMMVAAYHFLTNAQNGGDILFNIID